MSDLESAEQTSEKSTEVACNHCWHFTGYCLTSNPPQYQHICCHCGKYRNERSVLPVADGEHGEFVNSLSFRLRPKNKKGEIGMSENLGTGEWNAVEQPQPTMEQIGNDLNEWLKSRGVTLQVVAIGRSGTPVPIEDFMPPTHQATITLAQVQK